MKQVRLFGYDGKEFGRVILDAQGKVGVSNPFPPDLLEDWQREGCIVPGGPVKMGAGLQFLEAVARRYRSGMSIIAAFGVEDV